MLPDVCLPRKFGEGRYEARVKVLEHCTSQSSSQKLVWYTFYPATAGE